MIDNQLMPHWWLQEMEKKVGTEGPLPSYKIVTFSYEMGLLHCIILALCTKNIMLDGK